MSRIRTAVALASFFAPAALALAGGPEYNRSIAPELEYVEAPDGSGYRIRGTMGWNTEGDEQRNLGQVLRVYVNGAAVGEPVPMGIIISGTSGPLGCRGFCSQCHGTCISFGGYICICIDIHLRPMDVPLPGFSIPVPELRPGDAVMVRLEPLPGSLDEIDSSDDQAFMTIGGTPCPADFTGDGVVNSQDFFAFLTAFFNASPDADVNGDGGLNSQDYFDFLGVFFAGC